jgi:7,8-dihydropterin-6-yl-methyl-4-(beta-D-ribofuranosyl)aminobenzene 5'-phosphate synthase
MLSALRAITNAKLTAGIINLPASSSANFVPMSAPTTVVDLHPARPDYRGFITPLGIVSLEADPTFSEVEAAGGTVEKHAEAHEVLDSYFLIGGEIPRVTEYEKGVRAGQRFEDGAWVSDELILDERFVVCHVKGSALHSFYPLFPQAARHTWKFGLKWSGRGGAAPDLPEIARQGHSA